jgi:tetratricopeptide (TPR) repeat protein
MPQTVNGIGTHYYGKKNKDSYPGVCRSCGAQGILESYDTRLWFVVFFVPVIPLGRKRITDYCPRCSRHYYMSQAQWEKVRQESVSAALAKYQAEPSPEAALRVHGTLLGFHLADEAAKLRTAIVSEFPDSAELHEGLGIQLHEAGQFEPAAALFEKALKLQPDRPEAQWGVARARIDAGQLDQARELLRFLETPGAAQAYSLGPLEVLARAYQRSGRHHETLELCRLLLTEQPSRGENREFRKLVAASEKALNQTESLLPAERFSWFSLLNPKSGRFAPWKHGLALTAVLLVLIAGVLAGLNEYYRRNRTVYVVNDSGRPARLSIDGGNEIRVDTMEKIRLAEGPHHVKIIEPVAEEFDADMRTAYFDRFTKHPMWVVNVGGAAGLFDETIHYAAHPRPPAVNFLIGENFAFFRDVDYAFQDPPPQLHVQGENREVAKVHVGRIDLPAEKIFLYAATQASLPAALHFAETRLRADPENTRLLFMYQQIAAGAGERNRVARCFREGLWREPLSISLHRGYQDLLRTDAEKAALAAEYDRRLKDHPRDARLLYLRGRVDLDRVKAREYFRQACEADSRIPWPWLALAYDAGGRGDWAKSRRLIEKAYALRPDDPSVVSIRHLACLAVGECAALEQEYRTKLEAESPQDDPMDDLMNLCDVYFSQGKTAQARETFDRWTNQWIAKGRISAENLASSRSIFLLVAGDFAALEDEQAAAKLPEIIRLYYRAASGRPEEAVRDHALESLWKDPWNALTVSLGFTLAGKEKEASQWREKACKLMAEQDSGMKKTAALLRGDRPPAVEKIDDLEIDISQKSLLLAALAVRYPEQRAAFAEMARRLNVSRRFSPSYHLVRKVIEGK